MSPFLRLLTLSAALFSVTMTPAAAIPGGTQPALAALCATGNYTNGLPTNAVPGPSGKHVYFLRSGAEDNYSSLYVLDTTTGIARKLLDASMLGGTAAGLTDFQLSNDSKEILIPYADRLFLLNLTDQRLLSFPGNGYVAPRLSPDGKLVAAVKANNIYVLDVGSGKVTQLTSNGSALITNGLPDGVASRDFGRGSGFWWSPDSRYVAYEEANSSKVEVVHTANLFHPDLNPTVSRWPFAGSNNVSERLGIVPVSGGNTIWAKIDARHFPYLVRVVWRFEKAPLSVVVEARDQREEALLAVSEKTGDVRPLIKQIDPMWVSTAPDFEHRSIETSPWWLSDGSGFLWLSNARGDWELELRTSDGLLVRELTPIDFHVRSIDDVDERLGTIDFEASPDARQCQIYTTDFKGGPAQQLTHATGVHNALFATDHRSFVDTFSLSDDESGTDVFSTVTGFRLARLPSLAEVPLLQPNVRFFHVGTQYTYDAVAVFPRQFQRLTRYPVLLRLSDNWSSSTVTEGIRSYEDSQWYADQGFIVVLVDGRGSPNRGRLPEGTLKYSVATVPLHDQIDALLLLSREVPELDLNRVAVMGDGLGGYLASMAVLRRPDIFACGIAISPVTDWTLLDTAFAERYLDTPKIDPIGYRTSSVLQYADRLQRPLLIMQNVSQNSVGLAGALRLSNELYQSGKSFDFIPFSQSTNPKSSPNTQVAVQTQVVRYLKQQLTP